MRRAPILLAAFILAAPTHALAQSRAFLEQCGDPQLPARQAAQFCARALESGLSRSDEALAALNLGGAFLEMNRPLQARSAYERAIEAAPNDARGHAGRADALATLGDLGAAAVSWNQAVKLAPRNPAILGGRGAFRLRAGNPGGALQDIEAALRRSRGDPALIFNRALALVELGRTGEAEASFSALIRANPDDIGALMQRARLKRQTDRPGALRDYAAVIDAEPTWSQPYVERGSLYEAMGRDSAAETDFRRAWELGHRDEYLAERIRAIAE